MPNFLKKEHFEKAVLPISFVPATDLEIKAVGDNLPEGFVAGWASTPDIDCYGHSVDPNAFSESIQRRGLKGPLSVKFFLDHSASKIAGNITKLEVKGKKGLWIEAQFNLKISYVQDHYEAAKSAGGINFSVGFYPEEYSEKMTDGDKYWHITKGDLVEVSSVAIPANESCQQLVIKTKEPVTEPLVETVAGFEKYLLASGLTPTRTKAHEITLAVKEYLHLFAPPAHVADGNSSSLAGESLTKLQAQLNRLKSV